MTFQKKDNKSINNLKKIKKKTIKKKDESLKQDNTKNLKDNIQNLKDDNLRYIAEIDNLRKRFDKEKEDIYKYSISDFANEIILVVDNFERVSDSILSLENKDDPKIKPLIDGVELIFKDFLSSLEKFGIKKIDALGKQFDPNFHQSVFEDEDSDKPKNEIVKIVQQGYTIKDRLLRPVSVGISKGNKIKK